MTLTERYRTRFKKAVDLEALERLLGRLPDDAHLAVIVACLRDPTPEDYRAAGWPAPPAEPTPPTSRQIRQGTRPNSLPFLVENHRDFQLTFDDPELQAMWLAVRR